MNLNLSSQNQQRALHIHLASFEAFKDLMSGRFKLLKVQRIERKYNPESGTYSKLGDITIQTIQDLIKQGYDDVMAL